VYRIDADYVVNVRLDPTHALVIDIDRAEDVPGQVATWIGTAQFVAEREPRQTQIVNPLGDFRRHAAADPHKPLGLVGKRVAQLRLIDVRENGDQFFNHLVAIEHECRIDEYRRCFDVGCEQPAIAIDDIGTAEALGQRFGYRDGHVGALGKPKMHELAGDGGERQQDAAHQHDVTDRTSAPCRCLRGVHG
jgi:hypothetical protein